MNVEILGAHNIESSSTRLVSLLIDDVLAVDAGSISSGLSLADQQRIKSILISHHHFDHIKDIATFGLRNINCGTKKLCATENVIQVLRTHIINGIIYPDLTKNPSIEKPSLLPVVIVPYVEQSIDGYRITAIPVNHGVPTVGYSITSVDNKTLFYTSDTGRDLKDCWKYTSPQLLIIETTYPDRMEDAALKTGHLTPGLLKDELMAFCEIKHYIPPVVLVHMNPEYENEIRNDIEKVVNESSMQISLGYEGMKLSI